MKTITAYTKDNILVEMKYKQVLDAFNELSQELNINVNITDLVYFTVESLFDVDFETDEDVEEELQEQAQTALESFRKEIVNNEQTV